MHFRPALFTHGVAAAVIAVGIIQPVSAEAGVVTLQNGDQLEGVITSQTPEGVTLEHKTLGTIDLSAGQVKDVTFSHRDPAYRDDATLNGWFLPGWDKSIEAGFNGSEGNAQNLSAYAAFNTRYQDANDRWQIKANLFYAEDDNVNTRNEWEAGVIKDWLIPDDPLFYFASLKYEHDRFTGWEDRISAFAGIGYELVKEPMHEFLLRFGAGANYEFGGVNEFTPELLAGFEGNWKIDANQTFTYYSFFYPALDPFFDKFRNVSGITYKLMLDTGRGLSLKLGAENEHQSEVEPGFKKNDLKYFGALVYDF